MAEEIPTFESMFRKSAGIREMIARECFEKTGRIPDVEFMDTYEVKKAAVETDINDLQGVASDDGEQIDKFKDPESSEARKKISDMVNRTSPDVLNPGFERLAGPDGMYDTSDVGAGYGMAIRENQNDEPRAAVLSEMEGPLEKAIRGVLTSRGMSPEDIQSTIRQIMDGYQSYRDGTY